VREVLEEGLERAPERREQARALARRGELGGDRRIDAVLGRRGGCRCEAVDRVEVRLVVVRVVPLLDKLVAVRRDVGAHGLLEVAVILLLAVDRRLLDDACERASEKRVSSTETTTTTTMTRRRGTRADAPLIKLLLVHSTPVVTTTRQWLPLAQVMLVRVLTEKALPLGTSGVLVVVTTHTKSSKSTCADSSVMRHLVWRGPIEPLSGLMYDMDRARRLDPEA